MLAGKVMIYLQIVASVCCSALAHIFLKVGASGLRSDGAGTALSFVGQVVANPFIWLGVVLYVTAFGIGVLVLRQVDVSFAYPFISLGFILVLMVGWLVLGEPLTWPKVVGNALIIGGIMVLALGGGVSSS